MINHRMILCAGFTFIYFAFGHEVLTGSLVFSHDTIHWYGAFLHFILSVGRGLIPMWDPYCLNGAPFYFANNMTGNFDPSVIILAPLARFFNVSALVLFHWNYMFRLVFSWIGMYMLYARISRDLLASAISATLVFLLMAPNIFWQNGSSLSFFYAPWLCWCLVGAIDPKSSSIARRWNWLFSAFFFGVSVNLYLPSYGYILSSMLFLVYFFSSKSILAILINLRSDLISRWGLLNLIVCSILVAPFSFSALKIFPARGDYFNFHRLSIPYVSPKLATETDLRVTIQKETVQSTPHNFFGLFFTSIDTRQYFDTTDRSVPMTDHFLSLTPAGLFLFLLATIRGLGSRTYWLFSIPFFYITLFMYLPPSHPLLNVLRKYPGAGVIHLSYNFICHWFLCFGGICTVAIQWIRNASPKNRRRWGVGTLILSFCLQAIILLLYLRRLGAGWGQNSRSREFFVWSSQEAFGGGWYAALFAVTLAVAFLTKKEKLRLVSFFTASLICALNIWTNFQRIKPYVLQPGAEWHKGIVHYDRPFSYPEKRVPVVPVFADVQAFMGTIYRIPESSSAVSNPYGSFTRRTFDYLRFVSHATQSLISGIGSERYGFYTSFLRVQTPREGLLQIRNLSRKQLEKILIIEAPEKLGFRGLEEIDSLPISDTSLLPTGLAESWLTYYDSRRQKIDLTNSVSSQSLDLAPDYKYLGRYHLVLFPEVAESYQLFGYLPNASVSFTSLNEVCFRRIHDFYLRTARPRFYPLTMSEPLEKCDFMMKGRSLLISKEIRSPFITNDIINSIALDQLPRTATLVTLPIRTDSVLPKNGALIKVRHFDPNRVTFEVSTEKPGFFYYADSYSSEWRVYVNGRSENIYPSNVAFKSVYLPAGVHQVEFSFDPKWYGVLFWFFSFVSVCVSGLFLLKVRALKDASA